MVNGQRKVDIRRDAGQVVAGNSVTNIGKYVTKTSHSPSAVAFFSALLV